jgi:hypothetical protein
MRLTAMHFITIRENALGTQEKKGRMRSHHGRSATGQGSQDGRPPKEEL